MSLSDGAGTNIEGMEPAEGAPEDPGQQQEPAPDAEPAAPTPEPTERVQLGRRARAQQERASVSAKLADIEKSIATTQEKHNRELADRDAELHRLRGVTEALAPMLQNLRQPQQQAPQVTPDQLFREAEKALDDKDINTYQRKFAEAVKMQVLAEVPRPQQVQQQPQMNPIVGAMLAQHPKVLQAGDRGMALAAAHDNVLAAQGLPATPDRWKKAIELADQSLGGSPTTASARDANREVLSGIPTAGRSGAARDEGPGVELTALELKWANLGGMSKEEYAKYIAEADPSRLRK